MIGIALPKFKIVYLQSYSINIIQQQLKLVWLLFVFIIIQGVTKGNVNRFIPE